MEPKLTQQQSQKLILSPQIRQYLKLLQLPLAELSQAIQSELAENPILEELPAEKIADDQGSDTEADSPSESPPAQEVQVGESFASLDQMDEGYWSSYDEGDRARQDISEAQKRKSYQESLIVKPEALSDFLLWQIKFLELSEKDQRVADEIIGNIDEEGYLRANLDEIALACQTNVVEVERILTEIQRLDPPGIGSRNLQEALLIQLKRKGQPAAVAIEIVSHHLSLLEKRDWQQLAKILSVDIREIRRAANLIANLEPKPGRTFYIEEPIAVTPDATVYYGDDDENTLKIDIHDESLPEIRINTYYRKLLRNKDADEKTKAFIREKMQSAMNFIKALSLRKSTLREITEAIVRAQPEFFEKGFSQLRPLRLKDIAQTLNIHESTVSRALQGKYISTPQGTIPYKSFFSGKMESTEGIAESQKSVMEKIRELIEQENPKNPLSDQVLVQKLQGLGVVIARRTVAKYREMLKILPSHLRRKK